MLRLRIPRMLYAQSDLDVNPKDDDDQQMGQGRGGGKRSLSVTLEWTPVEDLFRKVPEKDLLPAIAGYLWAAPVKNLPLGVLQKHTDSGSRETLVRTALIQLMATPEYQLC